MLTLFSSTWWVGEWVRKKSGSCVRQREQLGESREQKQMRNETHTHTHKKRPSTNELASNRKKKGAIILLGLHNRVDRWWPDGDPKQTSRGCVIHGRRWVSIIPWFISRNGERQTRASKWELKTVITAENLHFPPAALLFLFTSRSHLTRLDFRYHFPALL